jgi:hypothetical protein
VDRSSQHELIEHSGIKLVFHRQHALLQQFGRVAGFDRHFRLSKNLAGVQFLGDDMNGAAADPVAGFQRPGVCVEAAIFREK